LNFHQPIRSQNLPLLHFLQHVRNQHRAHTSHTLRTQVLPSHPPQTTLSSNVFSSLIKTPSASPLSRASSRRTGVHSWNARIENPSPHRFESHAFRTRESTSYRNVSSTS
jgi:hypothetical protein